MYHDSNVLKQSIYFFLLRQIINQCQINLNSIQMHVPIHCDIIMFVLFY